MNPIRLVSGAVTLPAHAAAAVIGTCVGVATTGVRTTTRVVARVIEQVSGSSPAPSAPWPTDRPVSTGADPTLGAQRSTTDAPSAAPTPTVTKPAATRPAAKKAPAKKAAARKAPARKAAAKRAPSKQAAVLAPALGLSEAEVEQLDAASTDDITTPSGIPAAGQGINPDTTETDLHQPGTEPLMDPATVKAVASESATLRRAADTDKG
nr:hypothetical protein [uncultured Nocardioides sp.]